MAQLNDYTKFPILKTSPKLIAHGVVGQLRVENPSEAQDTRSKHVRRPHKDMVVFMCFEVCVYLFWPAEDMSLWSSDAHLQHAGLLL